MEIVELLSQLRQLNRGDKLHVMQFLVSELATERTDSIKQDLNHAIWSPYDAFEAADKMFHVLKTSDSTMTDTHA